MIFFALIYVLLFFSFGMAQNSVVPQKKYKSKHFIFGVEPQHHFFEQRISCEGFFIIRGE